MKPVALYYKILKYQPANLRLLLDHFELFELEHPGENTQHVLDRVELLFAPLGFKIDANYMDRCPKLRVIASNTTGIPHIDAPAAGLRGVAVCALHDDQNFLDTITPTAEHTIALILAAARRLPAAHNAASSGEWDRKCWGSPKMMSRMRLGLVGYGRLGKKVAEIAKVMGMDVAWYDPYVEGFPGRISDLTELARRSDILSLHAVANDSTRGIVSREVLEQLPEGAIVVNTARGELLDLTALIDLLESGRLWGGALDTIDGEYELNFPDQLRNSRVARYARTHTNLILTPHIGGSTVDAWEMTERRVIEKACAVFSIPIKAH